MISQTKIIQEIRSFADTGEKWLGLDTEQKREALADIGQDIAHANLLRAIVQAKGEFFPELKPLVLKKTETKASKGRILYEVMDEGAVIATRRSNKEYVACNVVRKGDSFQALHFYRYEHQVKPIPSDVEPEQVYGVAKVTA